MTVKSCSFFGGFGFNSAFLVSWEERTLDLFLRYTAGGCAYRLLQGIAGIFSFLNVKRQN